MTQYFYVLTSSNLSKLRTESNLTAADKSISVGADHMICLIPVRIPYRISFPRRKKRASERKFNYFVGWKITQNLGQL